MRHTPTAFATTSAAIAAFMFAITPTTATPDNDKAHIISADSTRQVLTPLGMEKPWQTDDGVIHFQGQTYDSWRAFFDAREKAGVFDYRCLVPEYDIDAWREVEGFLPPSDCSMSNTNPAEAYDPSVVLYRIPCVVHVIRNSSGSQGNMSEAMVASGIQILNEDFKALVGTNGSNGTDCQVEFYLATTDPNGNATNGITYSDNTSWYNDSGSYYNTLAWDPDNYINIYTNTASGALGYVPFLPQEGSVGSSADRVVVLWESFGNNAPIGPPYNKGRTLTHEVGHYLGLHHTFNGGCSGSCSSSGDLICDTSPQSEPTFGCSGSSCSGTAPDDNYMDYSDDLCMEQFTPNQSRRIRCTLLNYRQELAEEGEGTPEYIELAVDGSTPTFIDPAGTSLSVRINELEAGGFVSGSGRLVYATGGSPTTLTLSSQGNSVYNADVPEQACGDTFEWYFTAEDAGGSTHRLPTGSDIFSGPVATGYDVIFSDNGESDPGYALSATANDGGWTLGTPIACDRQDPANDGDGSGQCWLTDNSSASSCNSDIDGGWVRLTSPEMDASSGSAVIRYDRYFASNSTSSTDDTFIVEVSSNGASWVIVESFDASNMTSLGAWESHSFNVSDFVAASSTVQIRFTAEDGGSGTIVEAGVDGLAMNVIACSESTPCLGDLNDDGKIDGVDLSQVLGYWGFAGGHADLNNDGTVNGADLAIILGGWGLCPE